MPQERKNGNRKDGYVYKFGYSSHFTTYKCHAYILNVYTFYLKKETKCGNNPDGHLQMNG